MFWFRVTMCIFDPMWLCPFGQPEVVVVPIITIFSSRLMPGKMEVLGYILLLCDGSAAIVWLVKSLYLYLVECILWFRSVKSPFCLSKSMFFPFDSVWIIFFFRCICGGWTLNRNPLLIFFGGNPNFPNLRLIENGDTPKPAILNGERDIKL